MALSKEAKVGLLALTAGVILYVGFNFLKGYEIFSDTRKFFIVYKQVDGLTISNPVTLNGLSVGRVQNIQLMSGSGNKILVTIDVDEEVQVGDSTKALLANADLLGGKTIELQMGNSSKIYDGGDTLKGMRKQDITEALTEKAMPILTNLDSTVVRLNKVFGDQLGESVGKTLHNLEMASAQLNTMIGANQKNINAITGNLASLTASLNDTERQLKPVIAKLNMMADTLNDLELKQVVKNANQALKNVETITAKLNRGEGSAGLLINDKTLYQDLDKTINSFNKLAEDMKQNPGRYIKISVF